MIILEEIDTEFGIIKICESLTDKSRTYCQDSWSQSLADENGQSLIAYVHAMHGALVQANAHKVAIFGCAGGTLATMLTGSGCNVTAIDVNPHTFDLARRYFQMSPDVQCVTDDARNFLETTTDMFDGIAIDAFDNGAIPAHLRTVEFFRTATARLNPGGVVVINAIVSHDLDMLADNVAASLHAASQFPVVILDDLHNPDRNVVIIAGHIPQLTFPCGNEPLAIQRELATMVQRPVRRQATRYYDAGIAAGQDENLTA